MHFTKHLISILLCALLCAPALPAQDRKVVSRANNPTAQDVTIIIQQEQVRFTTQKTVQMMQLQVFNPSGEAIFDSGPVPAGEVNWPFQNANGEELKSGLYAYTLSIHESGAAEAQVRRGNFIVDRVKDRDGKTDRLWITSQGEDGVGTELTVARTEGGAIAGTKAAAQAAGAALLADEIPEGQVVKKLNGLTDDVTLEAGTNVAITPEGNTLKIEAQIGDGQVVKGVNGLTDQVTLEAGPNITITPNGNTLTIAATGAGNSGITELNGNFGVGTPIPSGRLHILGSGETAGTTLFQPDPAKGPNASHVHWGSTGDWYIRSATATGKVVLQDSGGVVGIGTSGPTSSRLTIEGQDALTVRGYQPVMTFSDSSSPDQSSHRIQSVHGQLNFFQGYLPPSVGGQLPNYTYVPRMVISNAGGVGIGTTTPFGELHIAGYGPFITLESRQNGISRMAHVQNANGALVFKPAGFGSCCAAMVVQANTGNVGIGTSDPKAKLDVAGKTRTGSLEITGGADFAENFDVNVATTGETLTNVEAGMVVSIDPANPGKLQLGAQAYDRRVAGVISGAGGVKPGMMMSQSGTLADGQHPVALSGRVYCWVDASHGAVEPGDLLTTSATPGHAMKAADPAKAQGAIIGKAMTGLKEGKGLVLVLVTLQ